MMSCMILGACTHEKEAQALYAKATQMQSNKQYAEAVEIYRNIIKKYPRSSVTKFARVDMDLCKKEHNTPIILKAVDEFPIQGIMEKQKGIMPLGKSIMAFVENACQAAKKTFKKTQNNIYSSYEDIAAAKYVAEIACSHRISKWQINSTDNKTYTASKINRGLDIEGGTFEQTIAYVVDLSQSTISAIDSNSCSHLSWEKSVKAFEREAKKMTVDYQKECSLPIKLEGVLK